MLPELTQLLSLLSLLVSFFVAPASVNIKPQNLSQFDTHPIVQHVEWPWETSASKNSTVDVLFIGDIMMGRVVKAKLQERGGNQELAFAKVKDELRRADLTIANLECALTDSFDQPYDPKTYSLVARTNVADAMAYAGIDAATVANNHTTEFGTDVVMDTITALKSRGIVPFGVGANYKEAHSPAILEAKGVKFAFLGYNDIFAGGEATASMPGIAMANEKEITEDIKKALTMADVVIPYFHWGEEYTADPNSRQRQLAYAAIDAGAAAVIASHPHWVQGTETYKGKAIVYSLGNFVFDQNWSMETRQGMAVHLYIKDKQVESMRFMPIRIDNHFQPLFVGGDDAKEILSRVGEASRKLALTR